MLDGKCIERIGLVLTATQAIDIYKCKLAFRHPSTFQSCLQSTESRMKGQSVPVAERFGVSPKTVRDIWNRRTWAYTTAYLWQEEESSGIASCHGSGFISSVVYPIRFTLDILFISYFILMMDLIFVGAGGEPVAAKKRKAQGLTRQQATKQDNPFRLVAERVAGQLHKGRIRG